MHVVINAIPVHPGGGLTVALGIVRSLRIAAPGWKLTVLASQPATLAALSALGVDVDVVAIHPRASAGRLFVWQNTALGSWLRNRRADGLLTINHFLRGITCPQVVYHLNLLRFQPGLVRGWRPVDVQERLRDWSAHTALAKADVNVFESRYLQETAEATVGHLARNGRVICIGLPEELIALAKAGAPPWQLPSPCRLVAITNPQLHKDNPTLVRMLADLIARAPEIDWRCDIAGGVDPTAWEPTRKLAAQLGIVDRITWHGFCNNETLTRLLRNGLCLVSTSRVESFAMVALEAMARGCPPVVGNCAAMPESIGEAGLLAEPGSPASFATAVHSLACDASRREDLVRKGFARIQTFDWATCGTAFHEVFADLHESGRSARAA